MPKLTVRDISIRFGGINALNKVSLAVEEDSFVGLMGSNGAGKTTILNCISRIYDPTEGEIHFGDHDLLKMQGDEILRIGISRTFQDLNFFSHISQMNVLDYVRLGQFDPKKVHLLRDSFHTSGSVQAERELKKRARYILEIFRELRELLEPPEEERQYPFLLGREGFPDLIDSQFKPIGSLSFAWRRRLDLARALASGPKLVLLDEPAQGLAPSEIENLGKILKILQKEFKFSALIVEHNVATLMKISDRIVAMHSGQKLCEGLPEEVRSNPEVIRVYLGATGGSATASQGAVIEAPQKPTAPEPPLLEVRNLDVHYGFAQALFSVSMKIPASQIVTILGTNGSGKSTLLRAISGVEKPTAGEILYKGEPIPLGWPELTSKSGIQYVPQGHVIFPELTVYDNLHIGALMFEKQGLKFKDSLERVFHYFPDLKKHLKAQAASLSGGQQQMLAIGQALIGRPGVLLIDEPSLGLSPGLVEDLFRVIQRISAEEKCSILMVEQSVEKALEVSTYIYILSTGVLIAEGTPAQFRSGGSTIERYLGFR